MGDPPSMHMMLSIVVQLRKKKPAGSVLPKNYYEKIRSIYTC